MSKQNKYPRTDTVRKLKAGGAVALISLGIAGPAQAQSTQTGGTEANSALIQTGGTQSEATETTPSEPTPAELQAEVQQGVNSLAKQAAHLSSPDKTSHKKDAGGNKHTVIRVPVSLHNGSQGESQHGLAVIEIITSHGNVSSLSISQGIPDKKDKLTAPSTILRVENPGTGSFVVGYFQQAPFGGEPQTASAAVDPASPDTQALTTEEWNSTCQLGSEMLEEIAQGSVYPSQPPFNGEGDTSSGSAN